MSHEQDYIKILIESLKKKLAVLDEIISFNKEQKKLIEEEKLDLPEFETTMTQKQELIDKLNLLDDGFETIYGRVKEELVTNSENHKEDIGILKGLISGVTEKSVLIQAEEERNRVAIENHFVSYKKEIRQFKQGRNVASNYYKSMSKLDHMDPHFMDKKK